MVEMRGGQQEGWRWNVAKHLKPVQATIIVSEPSDDAKAEREQKIKNGAKVVPFGFARVLHDG